MDQKAQIYQENEVAQEVYYDFRPNRKHDNVLDILQGYQGGLHSDKYAAYQKLAEQNLFKPVEAWT